MLDLSAERAFFEAEGHVSVRVGRKVVTFQICTVPYDTLQRALALVEPRLPKVANKVTKLLEKDLDHPLYQEWDQLYPYLKILLGLRQIVLRDTRGTIVWQSTGTPRMIPWCLGWCGRATRIAGPSGGGSCATACRPSRICASRQGMFWPCPAPLTRCRKRRRRASTEDLLGE